MAGVKLSHGEPKVNKSSLRYTDTVSKIVNQMDGKGFNEKFENLCLEFHNTIPERTKQKEFLDNQISEKEKYLKKLKEEAQSYENIKREFQDFLYYIDNAKKEAKIKMK